MGGQNKDLGSAFPPIRDVTNRGHMTSTTRLTTVRVATRIGRNQGDSGFGRLSDLFVQSKTKHTLTCSFCSGRIRG